MKSEHILAEEVQKLPKASQSIENLQGDSKDQSEVFG